MIHPLGIYQNTEVSRFQGNTVVLGEGSAADVDGNRNPGAIGGGAAVDQILYLIQKLCRENLLQIAETVHRFVVVDILCVSNHYVQFLGSNQGR